MENTINSTELIAHITKVLEEHPNFGVKRVHESLKKKVGVPISIKRVRKLMRSLAPETDKENSTQAVNIDRLDSSNILQERLRAKKTPIVASKVIDEFDGSESDSDYHPENDKEISLLAKDNIEAALLEQEEELDEALLAEIKLEVADSPVSTKNIIDRKREVASTDNQIPFEDESNNEEEDEEYLPKAEEDITNLEDNARNPFQAEYTSFEEEIDDVDEVVYNDPPSTNLEEIVADESVQNNNDNDVEALYTTRDVPLKLDIEKLLAQQEMLKQKLKNIQTMKQDFSDADSNIVSEVDKDTKKDEPYDNNLDNDIITPTENPESENYPTFFEVEEKSYSPNSESADEKRPADGEKCDTDGTLNINKSINVGKSDEVEAKCLDSVENDKVTCCAEDAAGAEAGETIDSEEVEVQESTVLPTPNDSDFEAPHVETEPKHAAVAEASETIDAAEVEVQESNVLPTPNDSDFEAPNTETEPKDVEVAEGSEAIDAEEADVQESSVLPTPNASDIEGTRESLTCDLGITESVEPCQNNTAEVSSGTEAECNNENEAKSVGPLQEDELCSKRKEVRIAEITETDTIELKCSSNSNMVSPPKTYPVDQITSQGMKSEVRSSEHIREVLGQIQEVNNTEIEDGHEGFFKYIFRFCTIL